MIRVLDKNVANKIAAGEVIERPISIIKELVENSLDAGASSLVVEIKNGGKTYIRVSDDGCGIPRDQVNTAFLRHATSKISTIYDLDGIETLGFRGEALSSISAVSRCELITKSRNEITGTRFVIHGGQVITKEQTGCPDGTTFIVTDLFYNTPARLKFLKSNGAESSLIIDFLSQIALAYNDVKIRFINNGNVLFSTQGDGDRFHIIQQIYHDISMKDMVSIEYAEEGISLQGYLSTPAFTKSTRAGQIYFVNGRVISSKVLEKGVALGYKERLFEGRHPIIYFFLHVDPATIDVNIHPNKKEIRFDDENKVIQFISQAIQKTLVTKEAVVDGTTIYKKQLSSPAVKVGESEALYDQDLRPNPETSKNESKTNVVETQIDIKGFLSNLRDCSVSKDIQEVSKPTNTIIQVEKPVVQTFDFSQLKVKGVAFQTYVIACDEDNFYLLDQHAAHERIFYEKLIAEYQAEEKHRQALLLPLMIEVSYAVREDSVTWLDVLINMGFCIEEFGINTYRISEIPMYMDLKEAEDFVNTFIENINTATDFTNSVVVNKLITMSCKAAVKANDHLKVEEITTLIQSLSKCINPFSCPHGRPTFIKFSKYDIEKMFKRV